MKHSFTNITIHLTPQSSYRVEFTNSDGLVTCWFIKKMTQSAIVTLQHYSKDYEKVEIYFDFNHKWNFICALTVTNFNDTPITVLSTWIHNCVHNIIWDTDKVEADINVLRQNYLLSLRRERMLREISQKYDITPTISEKAIIEAYADFLTTQEW